MTIIDTHLHLIYRDKLNYPWIKDVPPLQQDFTIDALSERSAALRHRRDALHMEVDVGEGDIEAETRHVRRLASAPGSLLRGAISACRPESAGFPAFLERQIADPFVQGLSPRAACHAGRIQRRRRLSRQYPAARGKRAAFRPLRLAASDRKGDPSRRSCARRSIRARPLRRARHQGAEPSIPGASCIAEIAARPNVAVKISGVVAYADGETLDARGHPALCRTCHRKLRLGSRRLGQRLAGLHADGVALDLDRGDPRDDPILQQWTNAANCSAPMRAASGGSA